MRERINRLAMGIIDTELPKVKVTPEAIDDLVRSGGTTRRELVVTSENDLHIKGLAYSSNFRVRLMNNAFGGTYNHLVYEVNTGFLEDGDVIAGTFYLVTNGGEREISYSFRVEIGTSGKALGDLKIAEDFAATAKNDSETALRLFEYRDFSEAPFMKGLRIRALYDGLKGRPDRRKELEEFLTGLAVKASVKLDVDQRECRFDNLKEITEERIRIVRNTWGYVNLEITADSNFIEIPRRTVSDHDFKDDVCEITYRLHPGRLHQGVNLGRIFITGMENRFIVPVTAVMNPGGGISPENAYAKEARLRFFRLWLEMETGEDAAASLPNQMMRALDELEEMQSQPVAYKLLRAGVCILGERNGEAALLLDECRETILAERQERLEEYCFYQYLRLLLNPDEYQKISLLRLTRKYLDDNLSLHSLFLIELRLDERMSENPGILFSAMRRQFDHGMKSPFLYLAAVRLLNDAPELMHTMGGFELQVVCFGARYRVAEEKLALAAAKLAFTDHHFPVFAFGLLSYFTAGIRKKRFWKPSVRS